jgi:antitoxin VapB
MAPSTSDSGKASPPRRARLFWNGRSQAVRLPKEFRFPGDAVEIRREGAAVILEPLAEARWPDGYWEWVEASPDDLALDEIPGLSAPLLDVELHQP